MENLYPDILFEYQGRLFPIIWRKKGAKDGKTDDCPFCGRSHYHAQSEGHRVAHCATGQGDDLKISGGVQLVRHGYYLKEY